VSCRQDDEFPRAANAYIKDAEMQRQAARLVGRTITGARLHRASVISLALVVDRFQTPVVIDVDGRTDVPDDGPQHGVPDTTVIYLTGRRWKPSWSPMMTVEYDVGGPR